MKNFTIIIPTMWIPSTFKDSIDELLKSKIINEIIIIDNDPNSKSRINIKDNRVRILTKGKNIFVNPAWNWGVRESRNSNIILLNDDIVIKNIDDILIEINKKDYNIIGLDFDNINLNNGIIIREKKEAMKIGFGFFIFIKRECYIYIPEDIKIWFGDNILSEVKKLDL